MNEEQNFVLIPPELAGQRLDQALAQLFPDFSRGQLQGWVKAGQVQIDGSVWRCKDKVQGGEQVSMQIEVPEAPGLFQPEPLALDIVYEDDSILVINKPAGLVVHPAAGNWGGTLLNGLLHHDPNLQQIPRAGIVHRLDKDTSGLMVVARTLKAHKHLVAELQAREVGREYLALVQGALIAGGTIDAPIARHGVDRKRMAVRESGKEAITHFLIEERFRDFTLLRVSLETGRTHQIRVHMAQIHHPIVGDPTYGGRMKVPKQADETLLSALRSFKRQALHAETLHLLHPETGEECEWTVPPPEDFQALLKTLREHNQ